MKMGACEPEAPPAVRPLRRPHHMLRHSFTREHIRVAAVRTARAFFATSTVRWRRCQNRRHPLHAFAEPHVIIPFVTNLEGFDAAGDRMIGKLRELGVPMRVN